MLEGNWGCCRLVRLIEERWPVALGVECLLTLAQDLGVADWLSLGQAKRSFRSVWGTEQTWEMRSFLIRVEHLLRWKIRPKLRWIARCQHRIQAVPLILPLTDRIVIATPILILMLQPQFISHLLGSVGHHLPLLSDTQVLKIFKTKSHFCIKVWGEGAGRLHEIARLVMVPENLVWLISGRQAADIPLLQQILVVCAPARRLCGFELRLLAKSRHRFCLSMVTAMASLPTGVQDRLTADLRIKCAQHSLQIGPLLHQFFRFRSYFEHRFRLLAAFALKFDLSHLIFGVSDFPPFRTYVILAISDCQYSSLTFSANELLIWICSVLRIRTLACIRAPIVSQRWCAVCRCAVCHVVLLVVAIHHFFYFILF